MPHGTPAAAAAPAPPRMPQPTVVTINSNGRQSASFIRVASAIGWQVRAQMRELNGLVAEELAGLAGVTVLLGALDDAAFLDVLFKGADLAFINTTHWGDEVAVGCALAHAAARAGVRHYVYSSLVDHSVFAARGWRALPLWAAKFAVESYMRSAPGLAAALPATFAYCGIYHNNFTSLDFPLFRLELQPDGRSFVWQAPFAPHVKLPWLDSEHDVGPAVLQMFKEGPAKLAGRRVPLAFSHLSPVDACAALTRGLGRPVRYRRGPIVIATPVPRGYAAHLAALEDTLGARSAPYFGPDLEPDCTAAARQLWAGYRGLEDYARDAFPVEEAANGLTWMEDGDPDPDNPRRDVDVDYQIAC